MPTNSGMRAVTANGALAEKVRVKFTAGSTTTPPQVEVAGLGEDHDGVIEYALADTEVGTVKLHNVSGTFEMVAAVAITQGAVVYGAAAGKISTAVSGSIQGKVLEAASGDGSIVEVLPA